jgi:DNA-binding GntR family transcriptional regulator
LEAFAYDRLVDTTTPHRTKRDAIVQALRRQIVAGDLPRGARMRQDELARQFDSSITPVREALRLLEAEGLLVSEPHRGARVAAVDVDRLKATYVVRRLVESYAMRRVATRLSPRDLARLREIVERLEGAVRSGDVGAFRETNREFHFYFYERCGMPGLTERIEAMWQKFPWDLMLNSPERIRASQDEHRTILAAVEATEVDAAAAATERHIAGGFAAIAQRLADSEGPVPDPFLLDVD